MMKGLFLKTYLNKKIYTLSKLKFSKTNKPRAEQVETDEIIENFDESEPTFSSLDEAREFLVGNKKSVLQALPKIKKIKVKGSDGPFILLSWPLWSHSFGSTRTREILNAHYRL